MTDAYEEHGSGGETADPAADPTPCLPPPGSSCSPSAAGC